MISCQSIYGFDTSSMKGLQLIFNPLFINLEFDEGLEMPIRYREYCKETKYSHRLFPNPNIAYYLTP